MHLLWTIAQFEFRYHLRQPIFYVYAAITLMHGFWATYQFDAQAPSETPALIAYRVLASFGLILAIATVLIAGEALTKDTTFKTHTYLYTYPLTSRTHFAGRFVGAYLTAFALAFVFLLGILLFFFTRPAGTVQVPYLALIDGFLWLSPLNCFIIASITLSLTVFFRSIRGAYLSLFLVVLYFLLTDSDETSPLGADIWLLLDPFGIGMMREAIDDMAFRSVPDALLTFPDMLFINRLLWLGLVVGVLAQAEGRFTINTFGYKPTKEKHSSFMAGSPLPALRPLPYVRATFSGWLPYKMVLNLARLEFQNLIRQPVFQITSGLLVILAVVLATVFGLNPDFPELPLTSRMTALRLPMGLFISLFLVIMTGELIVHERTIGFWPIYHSLPQPAWVLLLAKLGALVGAAFLLTLVLFFTGISIQITQGFSNIDWSLYISDLVMDGLLRFCQLIALGALITALVTNRLLAHLINLLILGTLFIRYAILSPSESARLYSFLPGSTTYSDLTGYAPFTTIRLVMHVIWWGFAGLFTTVFLLLWNRGVVASLKDRFIQVKERFSWAYGFSIIASCLLVGLGAWCLQVSALRLVKPDRQAILATQTTTVRSTSGRNISIQVHYYHPYQVPQMLHVAQTAIQKGEQIFGAYPFPSFHIREVSDRSRPIRSVPGQVDITERQGWTADYQQPRQLDYIDYLISREVFKQWLVHSLKPPHQPGNGFIQQSLAEYLALQEVSEKYGSDRLAQRVWQRKALYIASRRNANHTFEPALTTSINNDALERGRGALTLTSISQVWGTVPLNNTIHDFYQLAIQKPTLATADAFTRQFSHHLPDSLQYLTSYLTDQVWFDFKIGRIANLVNGLNVEIIAKKWLERKPGQQLPLFINDFVPLVIFNKEGREIYRRMVHPNPDEPFVHLPVIPAAHTVQIDPLSTWPEINKRDNAKIF
jgi:ABC-type transport system involved in multi-copper enzyme maturation permease subunit